MRFPAPIALPLLAAGLAVAAGSGARAAPLSVPMNHSAKLRMSGAAASVVVGNSKIADVTVVDTRNVFVTGKAPGATDVTVVDALGRTVFSGDVTVTLAGGRPVTVHRAGVASELACSPRCLAPEAAEALKPTTVATADAAGPAAAAAGLAGGPAGAIGQMAAGPLGGIGVTSPR